jgi:hypothetical protein
MVEKKVDLLGSLSCHNKRSVHGKDEFMSVTVRKSDPKEKVGIRLEQDDKGRVRVMNIATNGLFANSEVEVGDICLSVNGKRLSKDEGPETLLEVIAKANSKVTVVVKKANMEPRVPEKPGKNPSKVEDNNVIRIDSYYAGQSKYKEDGSLAFHTKEEVKNDKNKTDKDKIVACSITANKEDGKGDDIDETAGLIFVVQNKLLFVAGIVKSSCFRKTDLAVGDRVLSINDCNFRLYADAAFASSIIAKAQNAVTVVVEKGVDGFIPVRLEDIEKSLSTGRSLRSNSSERRKSRRSSSSKGNGIKEEPKPLRRISKKTTVPVSDIHKDDCSSDSGDDDDDSFGGDDLVVNFPNRTESYKEVVIVAPKTFASQEVGVMFTTVKNRHVVVKDIQKNSIFANTSLEVGDIVLAINGTDYRHNPDNFDAWKTCRNTKETVTMLIGKEDATFKQAEFNLDSSVTSLEWG